MSNIPAIPIKGIWLRHEEGCAVVYVTKEDGKSYEAIREHIDGPFSHHISGHGLLQLTKLDWLQPKDAVA